MLLQRSREGAGVDDGERRHGAGQDDVEPAQPRSARPARPRRSAPAPRRRRGRTPGPWQSSPAPRRPAAGRRPPGPCPSTWCSTPAVVSVRSALGIHASGTMSPTDPSAANADRTAPSAPGHNPEPSTGTTERRPGSSRTDVGARQPRRDHRQQPGREVDDGGRHAEAAVEHLEVRPRACPRCASATSHDGVAHGVVPCAMSPSTVADSRRAPAADGPQLHRRQVLRLVEHDVPEARRPVEQVGGLVEQHRVGARPAGGAARPRAACAHSSDRPRRPSAALGCTRPGTPRRKSRCSTARGSSAGQTASTYGLRRGCGRRRPARGRRGSRPASSMSTRIGVREPLRRASSRAAP